MNSESLSTSSKTAIFIATHLKKTCYGSVYISLTCRINRLLLLLLLLLLQYNDDFFYVFILYQLKGISIRLLYMNKDIFIIYLPYKSGYV